MSLVVWLGEFIGTSTMEWPLPNLALGRHGLQLNKLQVMIRSWNKAGESNFFFLLYLFIILLFIGSISIFELLHFVWQDWWKSKRQERKRREDHTLWPHFKTKQNECLVKMIHVPTVIVEWQVCFILKS